MEQVREENEKKKEYLKSYQIALRRQRATEKEIEELRMMCMAPLGLKQDGMPHGTGGGDLSDYMERLEELEEKLKIQIEQKRNIGKEIRQRLDQMQDGEEARLLEARYIYCLPWEQVAKRLGYGLRQVYRIHGKALKNF